MILAYEIVCFLLKKNSNYLSSQIVFNVMLKIILPKEFLFKCLKKYDLNN